MAHEQSDGADPREGHVEPEHQPPASGRHRRCGQRCAIERAEKAAGLLKPGHRSERDCPPGTSVEVCREGKRERHQAAAPQALEHAAANQPGGSCEGKQAGGGRDHGSSGEDGHAGGVHGRAATCVGTGAQQGHRYYVARQETADQGRRLLQAVDSEADVRDHHGQQGHHDVGIHRGHEQARRRESEQQPWREGCTPRAGSRPHSGAISPGPSLSRLGFLPRARHTCGGQPIREGSAGQPCLLRGTSMPS